MDDLLFVGVRCALRTHLDGHEGLVHLHRVADLTVQRHDGTGEGTGEFHGRLGCLNVDQSLIKRHHVAHRDLPGHDLRLDETFTHVGK